MQQGMLGKVDSFEMIQSSKLDSESMEWQGEGVNHSLVPPNTELHDVFLFVWHHVDIDILSERDVGNLDGVVGQRDAPVAVDDSGLPEAEDVLS